MRSLYKLYPTKETFHIFKQIMCHNCLRVGEMSKKVNIFGEDIFFQNSFHGLRYYSKAVHGTSRKTVSPQIALKRCYL